jgi:small subunit ribosomal protein S1
VSHDRSRAISDAVHAGDVVEVLIREIKDGPKPGGPPRVTLSLKALAPAPEGAAATHSVQPKDAQPVIGAIVRGKVDHIETYGVFVQIDGIQGRLGRGLVPSAELGVARGTDLRKTFPVGTPVVVKVLETGDRKLRLSIKGAKDDEERSHFEEARSKVSAPRTLGTLGDLLKNRKP